MSTEKDFNVSNELSKELKNPNIAETKTSTVKSILKQVFMPTSAADNALLSADDAYLRATYHEYTNRKKLFHELVARIKDRIKSRMEQNTLYAFISIEPETMNYTEEIADALRRYGYQVWIIGKNELEQLRPENPVNKTTMFMLIMWDKVYQNDLDFN